MNQQHLAVGARTRWYEGLTGMHWRVLKASFLGWIFDGYEALALVVVLGPMMHSVLSPEQAASPTTYAGLVIGITLLGWGAGGMVGGILADYIGRKRMMLWSVFLYAMFSGFDRVLANLLGVVRAAFPDWPRHGQRMEHRRRAAVGNLAGAGSCERGGLSAIGLWLGHDDRGCRVVRAFVNASAGCRNAGG